MRDASPELCAGLIAGPVRSTNLVIAVALRLGLHENGRLARLSKRNEFESIGLLMRYEGPEEQIVQNIESCVSSSQACRSHHPYVVRCIKEFVDVTAPERTKSPGTTEVTLIQMSFAGCEIWIALPGDGVTFVETN